MRQKYVFLSAFLSCQSSCDHLNLSVNLQKGVLIQRLETTVSKATDINDKIHKSPGLLNWPNVCWPIVNVHFQTSIEAVIFYTSNSTKWVWLNNPYRTAFQPLIKQSQHQTDHVWKMIWRKCFWCFQLCGDNIACGDPPDRLWLELTPVTQYMQMSDRQGSLVAIIHVQDLWLSRHGVEYIDWETTFPTSVDIPQYNYKVYLET